MSLAPDDAELIESELGRSIDPAEEALFENLWSEHCAYRSSRPLLSAFESDGDQVVIGPGDDAAVVALSDDLYITMGIESHNHPSYVDPYDGAATGVGGIVRDTLSMGAYPIALTDSLYFGEFEREHSLYLFEGVVEGIADYGNAIGVPTIGGSTQFHPDYEGNPLVNVACVGLLPSERLVTATAKSPGNRLVLIGNATGRDGLGGASFASEDLAEDAETADRPAVQVGDPYTEKLLIEANEALLDAEIVEAARDLGAAGLGGATSEMVAKGKLGADIALDQVHQREPNMSALEILLAESQERMCYEVKPEHVDEAIAIAERFDLGASVIGTVTDTDRYQCSFDGDLVVDIPAEFLTDGAPMATLPTAQSPSKEPEIPDISLEEAIEPLLSHPNTASKEWVFRQYDHEVGVRTAVRPGDDAAVLHIREEGIGLAIAAGADANWTTADPYQGARAVGLEVATNLAVKGATPLAAVDCLNGGNPETPEVYHGFSSIVRGLADVCRAIEVPIVGGNVSLYNDSPSGPIPPTPTLAMTGTTPEPTAPPMHLTGDGELVLVGPLSTHLGGSEFLATYDGHDAFPALPDDPARDIEALQEIARNDEVTAIHDISHGGLAVTLAEMVHADAGAAIEIPGPLESLVSERPGRALVETTNRTALETLVDGRLPVTLLGETNNEGKLTITAGGKSISYSASDIAEARDTIDRTLE